MIAIFTWLVFTFFIVRRLMTYLHIFQQEEYDNARFKTWVLENQAFDRKITLALIVLLVADLFLHPGSMALHLAAIAIFIVGIIIENNPLSNAKKKLVLTFRAKRILGVAAAILSFSMLLFSFGDMVLVWIVLVQAAPFILILANVLLNPIQEKENQRFRADAVERLEELKPTIIGITGSYGKTSVKHILGHVLQSHAPTLVTPGSVNTEMGITRIIREHLGSHHKFFVVEMGAYGIGSIKRLCDLTPPHHSIITAIGPAHLERFKTLDGTAQAKFEIAEAAIEKHGKVVIHESVLEQDYAKKFVESHGGNFITCGENGSLEIVEVHQHADGTNVSIVWDNAAYLLEAPLYGQHHGTNMALAFAMAMVLGLKAEDVVSAMKTTPQITHRLEVNKMGNHTVIDDAFNSNPKGFAEALNVMDIIAKSSGGRRILVTPGMVELGDAHDEEHAALGTLSAEKVDICLVVAPGRIPTFIRAYKDRMEYGQVIKTFGTFELAKRWLTQNVKRNDVVLLENDLPDLYEKKLVL